jgi:hypothetical protein
MDNEKNKNPQESNSANSGSANAGETQTQRAASGATEPEDFLRMKNWVQQARSDAERARVLAEQTREDIKDIQWELADHGRKASRSGWTSAIVALALVGACVFGYYQLRNNADLLAQFPAVQTALSAVDQRVNAAEQQIRSWSGDWEGMNARMEKVEKNASANLRLARDYATEQAAKVQHQLQAEMDNRTHSFNSGLSELEAANQETHREIGQLEQEIAAAKSETQDQLAQSKQETGRVLGDLQSAVNRNRDDFDMMAQSLDRQRLDFEISKDQTREVVPGVTLTVSNTNVSYQRVEGRLHVIADGRILWIRGQGIQQPVRFYTMKDDRPYEVVFTRVHEDTAVGYVLAPSGAPAEPFSAAGHSPRDFTAAAGPVTNGETAQINSPQR